jgi:hypothetical protein
MAELDNYGYALKLIESYIGKPLTVQTVVEPMVKTNKKGIGTLKNLPIVAVTEVKGIQRRQQTQFGFTANNVTETTIDPTSLYFVDEYGHFIVNLDTAILTQIWGEPDFYKVKYTYGFAAIPDEIETVARIIESNILKKEEMGGLNGVKQISTLDFNVALFDDKLISSNELSVLNKYKGV